MKLPAHDRYDYVPIPKRPVYDWPEGKRLAVFLCNNIEHFAYRAGARRRSERAPTGRRASVTTPGAITAIGSGSGHYLDLLDEFGLPGAHNVNSAVLEACPDIVERLNGRGDEYVGHGRTNSERQDVLWEEDEARLIAECTEVMTRLSGKQPEGWLGPGLAESAVTPRPAQGGRLPLCDGLAARRPAGVDADARRADPVGALSARAQRLCRRSSPAATPAANSPR